jgi:hypothetical protein
MIGHVFTDCLGVYRSWTRTVTSLVWQNQWKLLDVQYQAGIRLLDALVGGPAAPETQPPRLSEDPTTSPNLEQRAVERLRQGLAPPREIYEVQHRSHVDWSMLPDWARPMDPELFEGCAHEG